MPCTMEPDMGNNRRRQRVKRAREPKELRNEAMRDAVGRADALERANEGVGWCPIPNPKTFGGCLYRAAWEAMPLWLKMLDYRERLAWEAEVRARYDALLVDGSNTPRFGYRLM
jgi:hypothetical protein